MPRRAAFDRDTALQQAMDLFWSRGFHATSLKDIEAALDMRPGSIYAAFGSKEKLFEAALGRYSESTRQALEQTLAEAPTPIDGLSTHVRRLAEILRRSDMPARACMLSKTVLEATQEDTAIREAAEGMLRDTETVFATAFRRAQADGQIEEAHDPDRLASRLQAEIMGLRAYAQRRDSARRVAELAEDMAQDLEALAR